jgi:hypothetical protein
MHTSFNPNTESRETHLAEKAFRMRLPTQCLLRNPHKANHFQTGLNESLCSHPFSPPFASPKLPLLRVQPARETHSDGPEIPSHGRSGYFFRLFSTTW